MHISRRGPILAVVSGSLVLSVAVGLVGTAGAAPARPSTVTQPKPCQGKGLCDVISFKPQIVCAVGKCALAGAPYKSTITVTVYNNGKIASGKVVNISELSPNTVKSGSWCNHNLKFRPTASTTKGTATAVYSSKGPGNQGASFCFIRATVGKATIVGAIDQTDDPGTWAVAASPTTATRHDVFSNVANIHLTVTNSADNPTTVNGDTTTFTNFFPSRVGACGGWTPVSGTTGPSPAGQATLSYQPSPVGGPVPSVYCRFQGQEAEGGALSANIKIYQTKP